MSADTERVLEGYQRKLREKGVARSVAKKGRIIEALVLMPGALEYLENLMA